MTQKLKPEAIFARLTGKWPVAFYNPYYKKYVFASADKDEGDNIVELHESATDGRNYFIPALIDASTNKYTLYSDYYHKFVFGSAYKKDGDNVVELHSQTEDRNHFVVKIEADLINTVRLYHPYYSKHAFGSADKIDGDNLLELHDKQDDRQKFQLVFGKSKNIVLEDLTFDINLGQILDLAPIVVKTIILKNEADTEASQSSTFEYTVSETRQWSNSTTLEVGVSVETTCGVPFIAEGKISVSASVSNTFEFGKSVTTEKKHTETVTATVPGRSIVKVELLAQQGQLDVPYAATAVNYFEDGTAVTIQLKDKFKGVSAYNVSTVYGKPTPLN